MGVQVLIYNIFSWIVFKLLPIVGFWSPKLKKGIERRKHTISRVTSFRKKFPHANVVWFHCASLGEFEQALPLIKKYKHTQPDLKIAVSFFSPSGYEPHQQNELIDLCFYLPFDAPKVLQKLTSILMPSKVIIVKYEFWYFFLKSIKDYDIPLYLISAYFLPQQIFFKKWGGLHRKMLHFFDHIFVQDLASVELLQSIGIEKVTVSGDTRIDTALLTKKEVKPIPYIDKWLPTHAQVIVAGSTWIEDIGLLAKIYPHFQDYYWIIAPHDIKDENLQDIRSSFPQQHIVLWSERKDSHFEKTKNILIIDTIGLLKQIYQYADVVWIGGGFNRSGIHNLIEAAVFENSIYIGPNYERFKEAKDLVGLNAVKSTTDAEALVSFIKEEATRIQRQDLIQEYIQSQAGATQIIWDHIEKH